MTTEVCRIVDRARKGSMVQEFLRCRMSWVPPPSVPCETVFPSVFLFPLCIARLQSLAGERAGGPKIYDSKETLVLYCMYNRIHFAIWLKC
jgi:hypothetical protein